MVPPRIALSESLIRSTPEDPSTKAKRPSGEKTASTGCETFVVMFARTLRAYAEQVPPMTKIEATIAMKPAIYLLLTFRYLARTALQYVALAPPATVA